MRVWLNSALVQVNEAGLDEDKWPQGFGIFETIDIMEELFSFDVTFE